MRPAVMLIRVGVFRSERDETVREESGYATVHHVKLHDLFLYEFRIQICQESHMQLLTNRILIKLRRLQLVLGTNSGTVS
jgi:hypothetical protein